MVTFKSFKGFTIVELLIVIVVIAILASISVVAYGGIQQRAYNAQITAAARVYKQAFDTYAIQNSQLPGSGPNQYCLAHAVTSCVQPSAQTYWIRDTTTLEPALSTIIGTLPAPNFPAATFTTNDPNMGYIAPRGGTLQPRLDGTNSAFLIYSLSGSTTCPIGPVAGGTWPDYTTSNANQYTYIYPGTTICWVPLKA